MRVKIFVSLFILFLGFSASGQIFQDNFLYMNNGFSIGNNLGFNGSLNFIHQRKHSLSFGYSFLFKRSGSIPKDYNGDILDLFTFGMSMPKDISLSVELLYGRVYNLNSNGTIRLNLSGGLTHTQYTYPHNWERQSGTRRFPNYSFEYQKKDVMGLIIRPAFEFPFTRIVGVSVAPFFLMHKYDTLYGLEFKTMLGWLRGKKNSYHFSK
jgi:hypothetical protein